jgi:hypothetical protein
MLSLISREKLVKKNGPRANPEQVSLQNYSRESSHPIVLEIPQLGIFLSIGGGGFTFTTLLPLNGGGCKVGVKLKRNQKL